ncbi:MAG TPA: hypothetical protein VGA70_08355 [Longimicrobiales bacterium]
MKYRRFEELALEAFDGIPEKYREGIDGLVVSRDSVPHPALPDIYTLGHCDTEAYLSDFDGPDTVRSVVRVYYGSFRNLARLDPDFDWEAEIYETVEHEVRHHLESLARRDELGGVDYAMDESFKRGEGLDWDPWYYQRGEPMGREVYVLEDQVYIERAFTGQEFDRATEVNFRWRGKRYQVDRPDELGDVHFVWVTGGVEDAPPFLELVLVRRRSWWDDARRLFSTSRPRVLESEGEARPVEAA